MVLDEVNWVDCNQRRCLNLVRRVFPITVWLPNYSLDSAKRDLIAGVTVGLLVVPQALAYSRIAGLPPVYGLYSSYISVWTYMILGTCKDVTMGPTAIVSAVVGGLTRAAGDIPYIVCLSLTAGTYSLLLGLLQQSWIIRLISVPTLGGFVSGAVIRIILGQLGALLGIAEWHSDGIIEVVGGLVHQLDKISWRDAELGFIVMIVLIALKLLQHISTKQYEKLEDGPRSVLQYIWKALIFLGLMKNIIVVVMATVVAYFLYENDTTPYRVVGHIKSGLQSPDISPFSVFRDKWSQLLIDGAIVAIVLLLENISVAKTFSRKNRYKFSINQEMLTLGVANVIGSFFQCFPITASFSRSSVNSESGVSTPGTGLWSGLVVTLALVVLTPCFRFLPNTALAAVIIVAVSVLIDFTAPVTMWPIRKSGTITWVVTFVAVLMIGVEFGIAVGLGCEMVQLLARNIRPEITIRDLGDGMIIVGLRRGCNFLGVEHLTTKVEEILSGHDGQQLTPVRAILIDMTRVSDMDITALHSLREMTSECEGSGVSVMIFGLSEELADDLADMNMQVRNLDAVSELDAVRVAKSLLSRDDDYCSEFEIQ